MCRNRYALAPAPLAKRSGSVREQRTRLHINESARDSVQIPRFARNDNHARDDKRACRIPSRLDRNRNRAWSNGLLVSKSA